MDDTISELTKLFRSVTKIVKTKTEDYFGHLTPLDRALREVADEDTCSVPNTLLREIAKATNDIQAYHAIMQHTWAGLSGEPYQWRRIYKSLSLLEFSILLGPQRVYDDAKDAAMRIRTLTQFRYHDGLREQGGAVRQKAGVIVAWIDDPKGIPAARTELISSSEKYVGIENKPAFDFCAGRFGAPPTMTPAWAELGGAFRATEAGGMTDGSDPSHVLARNPYNMKNSFQTVEDAARTWGVGETAKAPPSLKHIRPHYDTGYDAPSAEKRPRDPDGLPPDEEVFNSGPDWWSGEAVAPNVSSPIEVAAITNPPGAPPVMSVNLLDDEGTSPRSGGPSEGQAASLFEVPAASPFPTETPKCQGVEETLPDLLALDSPARSDWMP